MFTVLKKVCFECSTNATGEYDPARVIGYLIVFLGSLEFLILFGWFAIKDGKFDSVQFITGLTGLSTILIAAATGVWIKKSTEEAPHSHTQSE